MTFQFTILCFCKDSANRVKRKIKMDETNFYFHLQCEAGFIPKRTGLIKTRKKLLKCFHAAPLPGTYILTNNAEKTPSATA